MCLMLTLTVSAELCDLQNSVHEGGERKGDERDLTNGMHPGRNSGE